MRANLVWINFPDFRSTTARFYRSLPSFSAQGVEERAMDHHDVPVDIGQNRVGPILQCSVLVHDPVTTERGERSL